MSARVTVGMAVYNGATTIADSIRSVLAETYPDFELLLVDDGSTDESCTVIDGFDDPRIRLLRNEGNLGLVATRNRIVHQARGEFIAWLDQDDLSAPDRMATQVAYLDRHPAVAVCGGQTALLVQHGDGRVTRTIERFPTSPHAIRAAMPFLNPIACNTVMMRRAPFSGTDPFRPAFGNSLDYDLWSRAGDTMLVVNLPGVLGSYRIHAGQTSQGAALERMNRHALDVQVELLHRILDLDITEDQRTLHRQATTAPVDVANGEDVQGIAEWFAGIRRANATVRASGLAGFDPSALDAALARQWTTVTLAAQRSLGRGHAARLAHAGARRIGLPMGALLASGAAGLGRRMRRRAARRAVSA